MILLELNTIKEKYLNTVKNEWLIADNFCPDFLSEISKDTKIQNEQYIQKVSDDFQKHMKRFSHIPPRHKKWKQRILNMLENILSEETIIGIHT